LIEKLIAIIVK